MATRPITWQNVQASNDRGASNLLVAAQETIQKSVDGGIKALEDYQNKQVELNTNKFMDNLYAITDVEVLQQQIQSGDMARTFAEYGSNIDSKTARGAAEKRLTELMSVAETTNKYFDQQEERAIRPHVDQVNRLLAEKRYNEANELASSTLGRFAGSVLLDILGKQEKDEERTLDIKGKKLNQAATAQSIAHAEQRLAMSRNAEARAQQNHALNMKERTSTISLKNAQDAVILAYEERNADIIKRKEALEELAKENDLMYEEVYTSDLKVRPEFIEKLRKEDNAEEIEKYIFASNAATENLVSDKDFEKELTNKLRDVGKLSPSNSLAAINSVKEVVDKSLLARGRAEQVEGFKNIVKSGQVFYDSGVNIQNQATKMEDIFAQAQKKGDFKFSDRFMNNVSEALSDARNAEITLPNGMGEVPFHITPDILLEMYRVSGITTPKRIVDVYKEVVSKNPSLLRAFSEMEAMSKAEALLTKYSGSR